MAYKLKTLIVFDTNSLRSTEAGEVAYSFFAFGRPFQVIEEFILENKLKEDIHLAIPTWAIEELKDQKRRQYEEDIVEFQKLTKRLSGMPHIQEITLPEENFNCTDYIQEKAQDFLVTKELKLIEIPESLASTVLQNMMQRVMKDERVKHPFVHAKKGNKTYKDAGFKDNIIWESLLHYQEIENYNKIIFLTADSDYSNCKTEFIEKWNKHFVVLSDENNVIVEIKKDYGFYITEREIYDFTQTEYFHNYLCDNLKVKSEILIDEFHYRIEKIEIIDVCAKIERMPPKEDYEESIIIDSNITVFYSKDGEMKERTVVTNTILADDETKDIVGFIILPELL